MGRSMPAKASSRATRRGAAAPRPPALSRLRPPGAPPPPQPVMQERLERLAVRLGEEPACAQEERHRRPRAGMGLVHLPYEPDPRPRGRGAPSQRGVHAIDERLRFPEARREVVVRLSREELLDEFALVLAEERGARRHLTLDLGQHLARRPGTAAEGELVAEDSARSRREDAHLGRGPPPAAASGAA